MSKMNTTGAEVLNASKNGPVPEKITPEMLGIKVNRVPAPKIEINAPHYDERFAQVDALDRANPAFTHVYQPDGIDAKTLAAKRMEVVRGDDGEVLRHRGDIVCRVVKEVFEAPLKRDGLLSRKQIKEINGGKDLTKFASAKSPVDFGDDDLDKELVELNNV